MRLFQVIIFVFCFYSSNAQSRKYETKIAKANIVNIYGNGRTVIGKIILNTILKTKIFLIKSEQIKDDFTGVYTTLLELDNKEKVPLFGVNISLLFSSPVISVTSHVFGFSVSENLSDNNKKYNFQAGQINRNPLGPTYQIEIKSENKILVTISGLDGKID